VIASKTRTYRYQDAGDPRNQSVLQNTVSSPLLRELELPVPVCAMCQIDYILARDQLIPAYTSPSSSTTRLLTAYVPERAMRPEGDSSGSKFFVYAWPSGWGPYEPSICSNLSTKQQVSYPATIYIN
jgi:hypothetical protein